MTVREIRLTDPKKAHQDILLINIDDLCKILPLGCVPVAVALAEGARALPNTPVLIGWFSKQGDPRLVRGRYIPTNGCMNLAATVNVVLYDHLAKGNNTRSGPLF